MRLQAGRTPKHCDLAHKINAMPTSSIYEDLDLLLPPAPDYTLHAVRDTPVEPKKEDADGPRFHSIDCEFAVQKPATPNNPFLATNALLKAVYTSWFDDLNRRKVRGKIGGELAEFAHIAAAIAVCDVTLCLAEHGNRAYQKQCAETTEQTHKMFLLRLGKLVPAIDLRLAYRKLCDYQLLVTAGDTKVRTEYLWEEMISDQKRGYDLSSYMYFAAPVAERMATALPPPRH